tara:strand:- start:4027 stop:4461 length:435 start_codon:yes stop_codon:yes gene_type:complete
MPSYEVGTVLWIIHKDRPGLMAYQVIEEITKKTLEGEKIQYIVRSAMPKAKAVKLETIKGNIFQDSEEAKQKLLENATRAIDGMVGKIQNQVDSFFLNKSSESSKQEISTLVQLSQPQDLKPGYQWVTMEDGSKVQVKLPETLS